MTTTAVTDGRFAGEVTRHVPAAGTREKLSHLLLAAVWTDELYRWSVVHSVTNLLPRISSLRFFQIYLFSWHCSLQFLCCIVSTFLCR